MRALSAHARMSAETAAFIFPSSHGSGLLPVLVTVIATVQGVVHGIDPRILPPAACVVLPRCVPAASDCCTTHGVLREEDGALLKRNCAPEWRYRRCGS
jgi:hypothetical protein